MNEQPLDDSVQPQQPPQSQPADEELAFSDLKPGEAWGESITKKRVDELEAILQGWTAEQEHGYKAGPFDGVNLRGSDVFWLAVRTSGAWNGKQPIVAQGEDLKRLLAYLQPLDLHLEGSHLARAHLEGANLFWTHLEGADFTNAHLEGATLARAHLEAAFLYGAHLEGANLGRAHLEGANLRLAFLDSGTALNDVVLGDEKSSYVSLADVRWGGVNLAVMDWTRTVGDVLRLRNRIEAIELGDEREARKPKDSRGKPKVKATRLQDYKAAVRANRQLATVLRQQGLNEDADRFAYKAQKLQREVLRRQRRYGSAFGSWFLDVIAGYGYRPMRSVFTYAIVVLSFAAAYFTLTNFDITPFLPAHSSPLPWYEAIVLSISSFHGRGLFPTGLSLGDPIAILAAFEAIIGLLIEITFIATFTQRFFAR